MQIIIDISEATYKATCNECMLPSDVKNVVQGIKNGTPLPKGHGRLIDADALNLDYEVEMADDWKTAHEIANCVKYAPTIIEADEEE
jgi:hypothetical protein